MSPQTIQTYDPNDLKSEIEESEETTLNHEVSCGYMGSFEGLFDLLDGLPGEITIESVPEANYTIRRILFRTLSLEEVVTVLDTFSDDLFGEINFNEDNETAEIILIYD